jgi:hypothetical protein
MLRTRFTLAVAAAVAAVTLVITAVAWRLAGTGLVRLAGAVNGRWQR